jgi:hypothetical protein
LALQTIAGLALQALMSPEFELDALLHERRFALLSSRDTQAETCQVSAKR